MEDFPSRMAAEVSVSGNMLPLRSLFLKLTANSELASDEIGIGVIHRMSSDKTKNVR